MLREKRDDPQFLDRFWSKVDKRPDGCWLWTACCAKSGYGRFSIQRGHAECAHRIAWWLERGPVPTGFHLHHRCETPACVNPAHLQPLSYADHKRAHYSPKTHCPHGHELTAENLIMEGTQRRCRTCRAEQQRAKYERNREAYLARARQRYRDRVTREARSGA